MITGLRDNEIFVFGSNLAGKHAGGAALQASSSFEAVEGVGEGLTGSSYAFPTLDENFDRLPYEALVQSRGVFYRCARAHPHLRFLMTAVGTGLAGYREEVMKSLFKTPPDNVALPEEWLND